MEMKTVCAWCEKESGQRTEGAETHGCCPRHFEQLMVQVKERKTQIKEGGGIGNPRCGWWHGR